jgi:hypothetical protein
MQATSQPAGLPAPTGRHRVGRASFELVDPDRAEIYSSNPRIAVSWSSGPGIQPPPAQTPSAPPTCSSHGRRPASCLALTLLGC